jgi:hypothetical protein
MSRALPGVFLASIYPILMLIDANIEEVIITDAFVPLILSVLGSLTIYWIALKVGLDEFKSAIFTILAILLFYYYGHIFYGYVGGIHIYEITIGRHRFFFPFWLLIFSVLVFILIKIKININPFIKFINYLFLVLVSSVLLSISIGVYSLNSDELPIEDNYKKSIHFSDSNSSQRTIDISNYPDIYYIVLDGYAALDTMKDIYNYDNSIFYDSLRNRGFFVADKSTTNHSYTYLSLSSTLNMMYMDWMSSDNGKKIKLKEIGDTIADNKVAKILKSNGYKYITFDSGYSTSSRSSISDQHISCATLSEFDRILIKSTILDPFFLYGGVRDLILCQFSSLASVTVDSPSFLFSHIIAPHPPFVFDEDGGSVGMNSGLNPWSNQRQYTQQLKFVNNKVLEVIDKIKDKYKKNKGDFIMIIQSDHGPASLGTEEMVNPSDKLIRERMRILNAYYVPDYIKNDLYENITPVNSFRIILSKLLNLDFKRLKDLNFFTAIGQNEMLFEDVTGIAQYE